MINTPHPSSTPRDPEQFQILMPHHAELAASQTGQPGARPYWPRQSQSCGRNWTPFRVWLGEPDPVVSRSISTSVGSISPAFPCSKRSVGNGRLQFTPTTCRG